MDDEQLSAWPDALREDIPDWWPLTPRGRVPAMACLARSVRLGVRPAAAYQPTARCPQRGRGGPRRSDEASREQAGLLASADWLTAESAIPTDEDP